MEEKNAAALPVQSDSVLIRKLEEKVFPLLSRLNNIKFLDAVRESVFSALPVIAVGFILFSLWGCTGMCIKERLVRSFSGALGLLGIWVSIYLPFAYRKKEDLTLAITAGILSFCAFIFLFPRIDFNYSEIVKFLGLISKGGIVFAFLIAGLFVGIESLLSKKSEYTKFAGLGVLFFMLIMAGLWVKHSGTDIFGWINVIIKPLLGGADSLPAAVLIVLLMSLFWLAGIHGSGVVGGMVFPIYFMLFNANVAAASAGEPLPYIITPPFFIWCMIGGTGSTLPLVCYMLFSKSQRLRKVAKISILPSLVNINEPLVFGVPLILNPIIAIPFLITPVLLAVVNYVALYANLVDRIFIFPIFTIPTPIYAYLSCLDPHAIFLLLIDTIIAFIIYRPFYKVLERSELAREEAGVDIGENGVVTAEESANEAMEESVAVTEASDEMKEEISAEKPVCVRPPAGNGDPLHNEDSEIKPPE